GLHGGDTADRRPPRARLGPRAQAGRAPAGRGAHHGAAPHRHLGHRRHLRGQPDQHLQPEAVVGVLLAVGRERDGHQRPRDGLPQAARLRAHPFLGGLLHGPQHLRRHARRGALDDAVGGGGVGDDPLLGLLHHQAPPDPVPGGVMRETIRAILGLTPRPAPAPPEPPPGPQDPDEPVISFRDVHLSFDRPILQGVSFDLAPGTTKVILGGSGSGKTTILRLILGLLKPDAGSIHVDGADVGHMVEEDLRPVRLKLGMVFQEGALFDSLTVGENVGYRLVEDGNVSEADIEARVREMLGFVGLETFYGRMPSELSGGQRRRVAFARALVARPQLMLYDEPTTGLDPITSTTITDLIVKFRDLDGVTSILVTHQLRDAFNVARTFMARENGQFLPKVVEDLSTLEGTEFMMLRQGVVEFKGTPHELKTSEEPYLREFLS